MDERWPQDRGRPAVVQLINAQRPKFGGCDCRLFVDGLTTAPRTAATPPSTSPGRIKHIVQLTCITAQLWCGWPLDHHFVNGLMLAPRTAAKYKFFVYPSKQPSSIPRSLSTTDSSPNTRSLRRRGKLRSPQAAQNLPTTPPSCVPEEPTIWHGGRCEGSRVSCNSTEYTCCLNVSRSNSHVTHAFPDARIQDVDPIAHDILQVIMVVHSEVPLTL